MINSLDSLCSQLLKIDRKVRKKRSDFKLVKDQNSISQASGFMEKARNKLKELRNRVLNEMKRIEKELKKH